MKGIKLVSLDATNTVLKFKIPPWQFYSEVAKEHGYMVQVETLKTRMKESFKLMNESHPNFGKSGVNWENWWRELVKLTFAGQLPAKANVDIIANKLIDDFRTTKCWAVADGSFKLLDYLKKQGIIVGVISNFDPRLIDILHNVGLYSHFNFIVTSYDIGYCKPDKRIFESALEALKKDIKPNECLHIGDDLEKDFQGAKNAGWHTLLVTPLKLDKLPSDGIVFANINELYDALSSDKVVF